MATKQFTLNELKAFSFEDFQAIEDSMQLMNCQSMAPMVIYYAVKTGQVGRFESWGGSVSRLIDVIQIAIARRYSPHVPMEVTQKLSLAERADIVEEFLDAIQPEIDKAIKR